MLRVLPANTSAEKILDLNPDGIFLSNGPGDPAAVSYAIETVKTLLGKNQYLVFVWGIKFLPFH